MSQNIRMKKYIFLVLIFLTSTIKLHAQSSNENFSNINIYDFIDELANEKIISFNTSIKPYKREEIYNALLKASKNSKLSSRMKNEISLYISKYELFLFNNNHNNNLRKLHFNKELIKINYKDDKSFIILNPIWGLSYKTKQNNNFYHLYGGLSMDIQINKKWHMYASLTDNTMSAPIAKPDFFRQESGGNYKLWRQNDFSEMKGGIIYSFNWGNLAFIKEHLQWGDNYFGSNILSGRTPSFPLLKFNAQINDRIELNYFHGWLVSEDIDSSLSYTSNSGNLRSVFRPKFFASNMLTIRLYNNTFFSFGNSIIYSDLNGIHPAYLMPFFFYKSIDHTINHNIENQNSQLFFNLSFREIKHLHFFSSLFVDEFQKKRVFNDSLNNFLSFKIGSKLSNWPFENFSSTLELNFTNPMTYQHTVESTTFETNRYNLGHYMRDNSKAINYNFAYKFINRIKFSFDYYYAMHADDIEYSFSNNYNPTAIPIRKNKTWDCKIYKVSVIKEFKENIYLSMNYEISNIQGYENNNNTADYYLNKFTPIFYRGKNKILSVNINIGF